MPLYLPDLLNVSPAVLYQKRKNTAPCGIALRLQCICESSYKHQITKQAVRVPKKKKYFTIKVNVLLNTYEKSLALIT